MTAVSTMFYLDDGEPAEAVEIPPHPTAQVRSNKVQFASQHNGLVENKFECKG